MYQDPPYLSFLPHGDKVQMAFVSNKTTAPSWIDTALRESMSHIKKPPQKPSVALHGDTPFPSYEGRNLCLVLCVPV